MSNVFDPWRPILESLEPKYQDLCQASMHGPFIKPKLFKLGRNTWAVCLEEFWPDLPNWNGDSGRLDRSVEWCEKTLETWKNCKRQSWDTWSFDSKKNAEKFITYYNIACPQ